MRSEIQRYGIVLLPDQETTKQALRYAEQARSLAGDAEEDYRLGKGAIPHCTLYQAYFPASCRDDLVSILTAVADIAGLGIGAHCHDMQVYSGGYLFWNVARNERSRLAIFQGAVLRNASQFHVPQPGAGEDRWMSDLQRKYDREHGYHMIGQEFLPHVTLARFADIEIARRVSGAMSYARRSWRCRFESIALALTGPRGQAVEIIASASLIGG